VLNINYSKCQNSLGVATELVFKN